MIQLPSGRDDNLRYEAYYLPSILYGIPPVYATLYGLPALTL